MTVVIDSGVLIAYVLTDEPLHAQATEFLSTSKKRSVQFAAPRLLRSEITAVVRKAVYQKRITHEEGRASLVILLLYPIEFFEDDALLKEAYELAARFNRPRTYDS